MAGDPEKVQFGNDKLIAFKAAMDLLNFEERWMYRGSATTPPCEGGYLWMVLATVYPIPESVLLPFKAALIAATAAYPTGTYDTEAGSLQVVGNWREAVESDSTHEMVYI